MGKWKETNSSKNTKKTREDDNRTTVTFEGNFIIDNNFERNSILEHIKEVEVAHQAKSK